MFNCEILADSLSPQGQRLTTMKITFPRFILAEFNTHRMFSRNSASSRAIPFKKMVQMVEENPFIPIAWQKDHKGMQGTEYFTDADDLYNILHEYKCGVEDAVLVAKSLNELGVTKQLCNRLLEPFMWHTVIVTATEWENFFKLRCPQYETKFGTFYSKKDARNAEIDITDRNPNIGILESPDLDDTLSWLELNTSQAEIHIQAIAELMWDIYNQSTPRQLQAGEWHIPFGDNMDETELFKIANQITKKERPDLYPHSTLSKELTKVRVATARCARISYETLGDNPKIDYEADIRLHDMLLESGHMSPFEHCAKVMDDEDYYTFRNGHLSINNKGILYDDETDKNTFGWCRNFRAFIQYRHIVENQ